MKRYLIPLLLLLSPIMVWGQMDLKITDCKAGSLESIIDPDDFSKITSLTISGTLNATDFKTIRDQLVNVEVLDLSDVYIRNYIGRNGTAGDGIQLYPNKCIPAYALSKITDYTATGHQALKTIILPTDLKAIEKFAFANCTNLKSIVLDTDKIPSLDKRALSPQRTAVFIKNGLKDSYVHSKDWSRFVILENTPIEIAIRVHDRTSLANEITKLRIQPNKINYLTISGDLSHEDMLLIRNYMTNLVTIDIKETTLTTIPEFTFAKKTKLIDIKVPRNLETIEMQAFDGCSKLGPIINLPPTITTIATDAFRNCDRLDGVAIPTKPKALSNQAFGADKPNRFIFN